MAADDTSPADSGYGNPYLDSLIIGNKWVGTVTWALQVAQNSGQTWSTQEHDAFVAAFKLYSDVSGLTFSESTNNTVVNINEYEVTGATWNDDPKKGTTLADHNPVGMGPGDDVTVGRYNTDASSWGYLRPGGAGFSTVVHELGHAMGLDHPHDGAELFPGVTRDAAFGDRGDNDQNQAIFSVMSYNRGWSTRPDAATTPTPTDRMGHAMGLMAFDIAAIQTLYGTNWSTRSGKDTYTLQTVNADGTGWNCIWDGGGNDTISNAASNTACTIDLRAAPLTGANAGGYVSYVSGILGGFTIANKVVIENAIGGGGADRITGNDADNVLEGGAGADTIIGGLGNDTASYANSNAGVVIDLRRASLETTNPNYLAPTGGHATGDTLISIENLIGSRQNDVLYGREATGSAIDGGDGDDTIYAQSGNDVIRGGLGADTITDTGGDDTIYGGDSNFINNGSFETVSDPQFDAGGYGYNEPIDGWTLLSGSHLELFKAGAAGSPSDGKYGVDLEGNQINTNVAISQVVQGLTDGASYRLAFDVRKVTGANAKFEVYWGGTKVDLTSAGATAAEPTTGVFTYYINVFGGAGTAQDKNRLTFKEIGVGDTHGTLLDNVRLYRDGGTAAANDPALDGNDTITLGSGSDTVYGHGGDDTATFSDIANGTTDRFDGGSGIDLLVMDWSNSNVQITYRPLGSSGTAQMPLGIGQAESYTREGGFNAPDQTLFFKEVERFHLKGGTGGDLLHGGDLNDILVGNGGDDTLDGGDGGVDDLNGGDGFDRAVVSLSGNGANTIVLKNLKNGGTVTLSNGTKLTSIEAIDLKAGGGDDVLDVRGTVVNLPNVPSNDDNYINESTYFEGKGGNDTLAVDLATSGGQYNGELNLTGAYFDGGDGDRDLLVMDWSAAVNSVFLAEPGVYNSVWYRQTTQNHSSIDLVYKVRFENVERFDLTGGTGNDTLFGADKDDRIKVIGGSDTATLGAGADTLVVDYSGTSDGGYGVGYFDGDVGINSGTLAEGYGGYFGRYSSNANVTFSGAEHFDLTLTNRNDRVVTGDGDDTVKGLDGADTLSTGKGIDNVDGGGGVDAWTADKSAMTTGLSLDLNVAGLQTTYSVKSEVTGLVGTATVRDIEQLGSSADNPFRSGSGNDAITTHRSAYNDQVATGAGTDTVRVYGGSDWVDLGANAAGTVDTLVLDYSATADGGYGVGYFDGDVGLSSGSLAAGYGGYFGRYSSGSNVTFAGVERFDLTLTNRDDRAVSGDGDDTLRGLSGNDTLTTGKGFDIVDGGADADRWVADKSEMTTAQAMVLDLTKTGLQGTYSVRSEVTKANGTGAVRDIDMLTLTTGAGNDVIVTQAASYSDQVTTGAGSDRVKVAGGTDTVALGAGSDTLVVDYSGTNDGGYGVGYFDDHRGISSGSLAEGYGGYFGRYSSNANVTFSGAEHFDLTLTNRNDRVVTGDGDDTVKGLDGADTLQTGKGVDSVDGGVGVDAWTADKSAMTTGLSLDLNVAGLQTTYSVKSEVTGLVGTATVRDIEQLGSSADNPFRSGSGNDAITTHRSAYNDQVATGAGTDTVRVYGGSDWVDLGANAAGTVDTLVLDYSATADGGYGVGYFDGDVGLSSGSLAAGYGGYFGRYSSGSNVTFAGVERFDLTLTNRDDRAVSGDGDDTLRGLSGNDTLTTGKGFDIVDGGADADRWVADKSEMTTAQAMVLDLTKTGLQGTYSVRSEVTKANGTGAVRDIDMLTLTTGAGNDVIVTQAASYSDQVTTGAGSDRVKVAGGTDTVALGAGSDTLVVDYSGTPDGGYGVGYFDGDVGVGSGTLAEGYSGYFGRYSSGANVTFSGVEHFDLTLTNRDDRVVTGDGDDTIDGRGGNDSMTGKGGNDTYIVDSAGDRVFENANSGTDTVRASVSYVLDISQEVELLTTTNDAGKDAINLTGSLWANSLRGNAGDNILDGGLGADTMTGLAGNDTYLVNDTNDLVYDGVGGGTDTVKVAVSAGRYSLLGAQQIETLTAADVAATGALDLTGNEFAQTLVGTAGANVLRGGGGADILNGLRGIDTADYGDKTTAVVVALNGASLVTVTVGGVAEDRIVNIENLIGGSAADGLTGDAGANVLDGGLGADTLTGLLGNDTYLVDNVGDQVIEAKGGGVDTVRASASYILAAGQEIEAMTTTSSAGTVALNLTGNEFVQVMVGNAGSNTLDGGLGADTMTGLAGNDTYLVDNVGDKVIEAKGGGSDTVRAALGYILAAGQEIEGLTTTDAAGTAAINLTGNEFGQSINGNAGANVLRGNGGADILNGLGGLDTADYGDKAVAVEVALNGAKVVAVTVGGVIEDRIVNIENVIGGAAADKLTGDGLANVLDGGKGADTLTGLTGNDTYLVDNAGDRVIEARSGGSDTVLASVSYTLAAGQEIEILTTTNAAGTGAINLTGNEFAQVITGNAGANILTGGAGVDRLTGGLGRDTFDFNARTDSGTTATTRDVILDFKQGEDLIDLSTIDANGALAGDAFEFLAKAGSAFTGKAGQLVYSTVDATGTDNDRTVLQADIDGDKIVDFQIELKGLYTLTAADFVL